MPSIPRRLLIVSDIFEFEDGSINLAPLVPFTVLDPERGERLKAGDQLELRRPDGTIIKTTLYGLNWLSPSRGTMGLALNKPITKADVPIGTEIWKVG